MSQFPNPRQTIENLWDRACPVGPILDAFEREIREQVAQEIETNTDPAPWMYELGDGSVVNGAWIDRRDGLKAACIARGNTTEETN